MLLSQIKETATQVWSPLSSHSSYLALGTHHSTLATPKLSIHDVKPDGSDIVAELELNEKFVCLDWGDFGNDKYGILAGGMADSSIQLFDVEKM